MIGGEFEINLNYRQLYCNEKPDTYYYASGRAALYQILMSLKVKRVWLPDYLCESIVAAVTQAGAEYVFYTLDDNLDVNLESLHPVDFDAILLINYFGLKDLTIQERTISQLFPLITLIEDDVQAFYEFYKSENNYANYRFTSLRKTFAIPDGGLVFTKNKMPFAEVQNSFSFYKFAASILKAGRQVNENDDEYLALFEKGECLIDENYYSKMSDESRVLFNSTDLEDVSQKRRENAMYLLNGLNELGIRTIVSIPDGHTPLFIPVWLENRDEVRQRMFSNEVYCPIHWPLNGLLIKKGAEMAKHELSLILDQRYGRNEMNMILDNLK